MFNIAACVALAVGVLFGFWIPGYLFSLLLESEFKAVSSFLLSILILFHGIFWLGIFGIALTYLAVVTYLVAVSLLAVIILHKRNLPLTQSAPATASGSPLFLTAFIVFGLLMIVRSIANPLRGYDTFFRWNFLAEQIFKYHHFQFYPPLSASDFQKYFYVDAIAPVVSFSYWWIYQSFGACVKSLTALFVVPQYLLLLALTFRIAERLENARAGLLATGLLVASPLTFWSVYMGQETGLTALSVAATLYFVLQAKEGRPEYGMILAGCATAIGILAREYGVAFLLCGLIMAVASRHSARSIVIYLVSAFLLSSPWYFRNWILTGNPIFSNPVGNLFPVNPVHAGLLQTFQSLQGFGTQPVEKLFQILRLLIQYSALQFTVGLLACIACIKRFGYLVACAMILVLVWGYTASIAAGGYFWSLRALSPALVILSVLSGVFISRISKTVVLSRVFAALILLACLQSFVYSLVIPASAALLSPGTWLVAALQPDDSQELWASKMAPALRPLQCRILTDNAYAHAALYPYGLILVPVWSPEVSFVFDHNLSPESIRHRLLSIGIKGILYDPKGPTSLYYSKFPFFSEDKRHWKIYLSDSNSVVYLLPDATGVSMGKSHD